MIYQCQSPSSIPCITSYLCHCADLPKQFQLPSLKVYYHAVSCYFFSGNIFVAEILRPAYFQYSEMTKALEPINFTVNKCLSSTQKRLHNHWKLTCSLLTITLSALEVLPRNTLDKSTYLEQTEKTVWHRFWFRQSSAWLLPQNVFYIHVRWLYYCIWTKLLAVICVRTLYIM